MANDNVTSLEGHRRTTVMVAEITMPPLPELPPGPFTVTVANAEGAMWEVVFPDYTGEVPTDQYVLGQAGPGTPELLVNLLTGALRLYLGRP